MDAAAAGFRRRRDGVALRRELAVRPSRSARRARCRLRAPGQPGVELPVRVDDHDRRWDAGVLTWRSCVRGRGPRVRSDAHRAGRVGRGGPFRRGFGPVACAPATGRGGRVGAVRHQREHRGTGGRVPLDARRPLP
ncbi:hypothetical protein BACI9J_740003 [Bacillus altitudinis]|nr:hypothetical protein BACI9J_740003 [Bacillus altitudinis]